MLKQHQDLLATIERAEEQARSLYARGARVDETVRTLHQAGNQVKERIAHYKRDAAKQKAEPAETSSPSSGPLPEGEAKSAKTAGG